MEEIEGKVFCRETVRLDDKNFVHCSFEDCLLTYGGERCEWKTTDFHNCRIVLDGAANNTVQVLKGLGFTLTPPGPEALPEFRRLD